MLKLEVLYELSMNDPSTMDHKKVKDVIIDSLKQDVFLKKKYLGAN